MTSAPADFRVDVVKASVLNAEQRVYDYLRHRGWPCKDRRADHLGWDFEVYPHPGIRWRLDVKADSYFDGSARVPFESHHVYPEGGHKLGWGRNEDLDIVAVVGTTTWRCAFVRVREFRALVERASKERFMPAGWVPFAQPNLRGGYVTHGWAVPMDALWTGMAMQHVATLPEGEL